MIKIVIDCIKHDPIIEKRRWQLLITDSWDKIKNVIT